MAQPLASFHFFSTYFSQFFLIIMSDTPENASIPPKPSKLVDAVGKLGKRIKNKLTFRLPYELEWKLQYACLMLAGNPKAANTWQAMLEIALINHFDHLEKKGIVTFPPVPPQIS